jgi:hypothetical protein
LCRRPRAVSGIPSLVVVRAAHRHAGRRQRAAWFAVGRPFSEWVFASVHRDGARRGERPQGVEPHPRRRRRASSRTASDAAHVRLAPAAEGAPITYVSRQLGHRDAAITLRVYAHWLPSASTYILVNRHDDTASDVTQASPATPDDEVQRVLSRFDSVVSRGGIEPPTRRLRVCCSAN